MSLRNILYTLHLSILLAAGNCYADSSLDEQYIKHCQHPSDINEHLPVLRQLASECSSVVELGLRGMTSSWGILKGLSESPHHTRSYVGVDIHYPPEDTLLLANDLCQQHQISFNFLQANDLQLDIEPVDMLFIDTLHIYCQLTSELEKFSPNIRKYIVMHDTSYPWGEMDDTSYHGNYSEYPLCHNHHRRGLWPAIIDFLRRHPEWKLKERRTNNHGLTTLVRVQ
jgi:hypothetical protein